MWENKIYPYSSYKYYLSGEKHLFCDTKLILSYFSKNNPSLDYRAFVGESEIKGMERPELFDSLIDYGI